MRRVEEDAPVGAGGGDRSADAAPAVRTAARSYLDHAGGDARLALHLAVADGMAATRLVSRGFARWGAPGRKGTERDGPGEV